MSVRTKKHLTNHQLSRVQQTLYVVDENKLYAIPQKIAQKYLIETKKALRVRDDNLSVDEIFAEFDKKLTKAGALLKGVRAREGLSQEKFAKKIGVSQVNLSKMENGKRAIGRTVAKRIAKAFKVNYRYFLE